MRFGFFFFAEYVNVFIISALTVTLFFGGWNAPFPGRGRSRWTSTRLVGRRAAARRRHRAGRPDAGLRRAVLDRQLAHQDVAGAARRVRPGQPVHRRADLCVGVHRPRLGRRYPLVHGQGLPVRVHVRVDARHAAPRAHRPAHGLRLEVAAARRPCSTCSSRRPRSSSSRRPADEPRSRASASPRAWR